MPFRYLFRRPSVATHRLKKTHFAFTLVLVGCLLFSIIPQYTDSLRWSIKTFRSLIP